MHCIWTHIHIPVTQDTRAAIDIIKLHDIASCMIKSMEPDLDLQVDISYLHNVCVHHAVVSLVDICNNTLDLWVNIAVISYSNCKRKMR